MPFSYMMSAEPASWFCILRLKAHQWSVLSSQSWYIPPSSPCGRGSGVLRARLGLVGGRAPEILGFLSAVGPARLHRRYADGPASGEQVDAVEVVGGFLEPEAARLVVVSVPLAEVHPAVRYVVYGLDLVDRTECARLYDL